MHSTWQVFLVTIAEIQLNNIFTVLSDKLNVFDLEGSFSDYKGDKVEHI